MMKKTIELVAFVVILAAVARASTYYVTEETIQCNISFTNMSSQIISDCWLINDERNDLCGSIMSNIRITNSTTCTCGQSCNLTLVRNTTQYIPNDCSMCENISTTESPTTDSSTTPVSETANNTIPVSLADLGLADLTDCNYPLGLLCKVMIGFGCVVTALMLVITTLCIVITCLVARGRRYQYLPNEIPSRTESDLSHNQQQQMPSRSQNSDAAHTNLYHTLEPNYDEVQRKQEAVQYTEPESLIKGKSRVNEQEEGLAKAAMQSQKMKASQEEISEQVTGVFYDELVGTGYNKGSKKPETSMPNYSSIQTGEMSLEEKQGGEEIPLYSIPDMNKKAEARKNDSMNRAREVETSSQQIMKSPVDVHSLDFGATVQMGGAERNKRKSPSPLPPELPPKPGQVQEEETYAEVSSKPLTSSSQWNKGQLQLERNFTVINSRTLEKGNTKFPRSYSVEDNLLSGSVGGGGGGRDEDPFSSLEAELRQLYDEPLNLNLASNNSPKMPRNQSQEEDDDRLGYFRAS